MPLMSIQAISGVEISVLAKIVQLHAKLPRTAAIERKLLRFRQRRVKSVITAAEPNGRSKTIHGRKLLVVNFKISGC